MRLVVSSDADAASVNIRDRLLERAHWDALDIAAPVRAWRRRDALLLAIPGIHLDADGIDEVARETTSDSPDLVVIVSRHQAKSGRNSLTVHPIGNWGRADFGGRDGEVVPSSPGAMTDGLRRVASAAGGLGYEATFEATHHGPYLETPTFYIEVGTGPETWGDPGAASVLADAVLNARDPGYPVALGFGGGHYVPRITDVALRRKVSFGHLAPSYALDSLNPDVVAQAIERTPGASLAYFHRKAIPSNRLRELEATCRDQGLEVVREADLEPLPPSENL